MSLCKYCINVYTSRSQIPLRLGSLFWENGNALFNCNDCNKPLSDEIITKQFQKKRKTFEYLQENNLKETFVMDDTFDKYMKKKIYYKK